ncbi:glycosyltransferase [Chryseobacterium formosus]|uniref:Glycosyltransferase n=1 Tax=Chryseobacterium formosus TaxID=1537363 RepID=A0ABT3XN50_9FLAO|nr:glycosyltransferase [Chryseobacterium formosus]MCX8523568.1 glycosyltransferase [Chryseobacterium formosus]
MEKKIKIVQFVEAFGGGVYTYVKDLSNFLATNQSYINCEIHLIYSPNRVELDKELFHKEIHQDIFLYEVDMQRPINLKKDKIVFTETRKLLKKIKPDIIHLHSAKAGVIGRLACLGIVSQKNVYYSPHGFSFVQQNISKIKILFFKIIEYAMPSIFGGTIIASGNTEFELAKKIGKTTLIRNGVDFELPNKLYSPVINKRFTVGTVGRLTPQKNPKTFNKIASLLPDVDFIWIGNGELIDDITSKNIKVTGWIRTREELLQTINSLDLYIQVSLWEGLPIAILEAMAMRKPLVVSNVIGNKDTVDDNYNGFVYNTTEEAIEKIRYFLNEEQRNAMGNNSYEKVFNEYNKNNNFLKLIDIYKQVKV